MAGKHPYTGFVTAEPELVRAADRLSEDIFGAGSGNGERLVVTERTTGAVVGAAELSRPGRPPGTDAEFDLSAFAGLRGSLVEVERLCVHQDHRGGAAVGTLLTALAKHAGDRYLTGRVSLPVADDTADDTAADTAADRAARAWAVLRERHLAPARLRVEPRLAWQPPRLASLPLGRARHASVPPLLRGCLRLGAVVCGPPAYVPAREAADLVLLLRLDRVDERYARHFGPRSTSARVG